MHYSPGPTGKQPLQEKNLSTPFGAHVLLLPQHSQNPPQVRTMKSLDLVAKGKIKIVFLGDDLFFGRMWVVHVLPMQPPLSLSSVSITAPLHFRDKY